MKKRFYYVSNDAKSNEWAIDDTLTDGRYAKRIGGEVVVDLLNSLSKENEQLKKNPKCRENFDLNLCCEANNRLVKENEQLKNDCGILVQSNQDYRKENEQLKSDVERHRRNFKAMEEVKCELADENEQLKQLLDYADDLIQSHLSEHFVRQWENMKGDVE